MVQNSEWTSFADRFRAIARARPESPALVAQDRQISYAELEDLAGRVASRVFTATPATGEFASVAVVMDHDIDMVIAIAGITMAGGCYIGLSPDLPPLRLKSALRLTGSGLVLTDRANVERSRAAAGNHASVLVFEDIIADPPLPLRQGTPRPQAPGVLLLTSGSTGESKIVVHSHFAMLQSADQYCEAAELTAADRVGLMTRCSFAPAIFAIFGPLMTGASIHPYDLPKEGFSALKGWLQEMRISLLYTVPTAFRRIVKEVGAATELPELRLWHLGGEPVLASDVHLVRQRFPSTSKVLHTMGSTETLFVAGYLVDKETDLKEVIVPIGWPLRGVAVRVEDSAGQEVANGEVGELVVTSTNVAHGYWQRPDLSEGRFFPPAKESGAWTCRTGDLARRLADGALVHMGRKDNQIKINGVRVEPAEAQAVVSALPGVREAVVLSQRKEDGAHLLVAYVIPEEPGTLEPSRLRAEAGERLPLAMTPSVFIELADIPLTDSGKVNATVLPKPVTVLTSRNEGESAATDEGDLFLGGVIAVFEQALQRPVGPQDDFFELGGGSLMAAELMRLIAEHFNVNLTVSAILDFPTPALLASRVSTDIRTEGADGIVRLSSAAESGDKMEPIFFVPGLGGHVLCFRHLVAALGPGRLCYGMEYPGLDGAEEPAHTIEDLADRLTERIISLAPQGPISLVAYSMGGAVSFEIVRRLQKLGRKPNLLAFIDCYAPWAMRPLSIRTRVVGWSSYLADGSQTGRFRLLAARTKNILTRGRRPPDVVANPGFEHPEGLLASVSNRYTREVVRACYDAVRSYRPAPVECDVLQFRAADRALPPRAHLDTYSEWHQLATGRVSEVVVPGAHRVMLLSPAVEIIAKHLLDRLTFDADASRIGAERGESIIERPVAPA